MDFSHEVVTTAESREAEGRAESARSADSPQPQLGLWDAVSIIIGIVVGAGIYETAPLVLANVPSPWAALGVWITGGALSLVGAACYAELASAYPRSGGDYVYLSRAFSPAVGFLFGWAQLTVILTGSIGMMAYVFADYAVTLWGVDGLAATLLAVLAVVGLTALNAVSVSVGKRAQNVLTAAKVLGLTAIVIAGLVLGGSDVPAARTTAIGAGSIGLAMIFVLYTFGGWNDAAFVAAEVKNPSRNLPRALLLGTLAVTVIYLLVNVAFIWGLGFERARASKAIAAELLTASIGPIGGKAMAVIVMISALGAVSALIFAGARLHASVGAEHRALRALGRWHPRLGVPLWSLVVQLAITLGMMLVVGTAAGRGAVDGAVVAFGMEPPAWSGHGGFDSLLRCTAPVFWGFFLLTGMSLFVLRWREPDHPRPFRVPAYPVVPLLFCATCAYMVYSAVDYAGGLALVGMVPLLVGLPVYWLSRDRAVRPVDPPAPSISRSGMTGERKTA